MLIIMEKMLSFFNGHLYVAVVQLKCDKVNVVNNETNESATTKRFWYEKFFR